jgi:hypothetical protein
MNLKNNTPQILTGLLILGMLFVVIADIQAQKLNALLSYSTFYSPQDGPYIETYLKISGNSIHLEKNEDGKYQGKVQVIMIFKKNESVIN